MKRVFLLLIIGLFVLGITPSAGQVVESLFIKSAGGATIDTGRSIAIDEEGNIYVTGEFNTQATFDNVTLVSAGSLDVFIAKYDPSGNLVWAKRAGGTNPDMAYGIAVSGNDVYITGHFMSTANFNSPSSTGINEISSEGNKDIFIAKYNTNGEFKWAKRAGGASFDNAYGIAASGNGIYIAGVFENTANFNTPSVTGSNEVLSAGGKDVFIAKYNNDGDFQWVKRAGGVDDDNAFAIAAIDTEVYVVGMFEGALNFNTPSVFGSNEIISAGFQDVFIAKYNSDGDFQWARRAGGILSDKAKGIAVSDSSVYVVGGIRDIANFNTPSASGNNELITASSSYDIFLAKYNSAGDFQWAKQAGGIGSDIAHSVAVSGSDIYITGEFSDTFNFNTPSALDGNEISATGATDIFIARYNNAGDFQWAKRGGGTYLDISYGIAVSKNDVCVTGQFWGEADFNTPSATGTNVIITEENDADIFIAKYVQPNVYGYIYNDINENCIRDAESGIANRKAIIQPVGGVVETNANGFWYLDSLYAGTYTITYDTSGAWQATCSNPQTFTVANSDSFTQISNFGLINTEPCPVPNISVFMPFMRPGFSNQKIYVTACNEYTSTGVLADGYVIVQLDELLTLDEASISYTDLGENNFRFNINTLNPGQCESFELSTTLSMGAVLNQTLCMEANLYPIETCIFDTVPAPTPPDFTPCLSPWDESDISIRGMCVNDSIIFIITNSGIDMECFSPVRLYIDGEYTWLDSLMLSEDETFNYVFSGDGRTWRLEIDQHPLRPGNSRPNASIERCGNPVNWTPDLINILPHDDEDPIKDIYCGLVTGSYDPNDKTGYPLGVGEDHLIAPDQKIDYVIRFQNTGTDTAFTVKILDTLSADLDIFSVRSGASSHDYTFRIYGQRILEWTFNNILLPDSTTNEPASNGFVTFTVNQVNDDLLDGTEINNSADIYFDYNAPIITNTTNHIINRPIRQAGWTEEKEIIVEACNEYEYNNYTYIQTGDYFQIKNGESGDTLVHLNLLIKESSANNITESVCDSYTAPDGQIYTSSELITAVIQNAAGCDSTITVDLSVFYTDDIDLTVMNNGDTILIANATGATYQWIDCNNGNISIIGAIHQDFTPNASGSYAVIITQNDCTDTSMCQSIKILELVSSTFGNITIFPNPNNGNFTLDFGKQLTNAKITVKDVLGKQIYTKTLSGSEFNIYLEEAKGVYFITIQLEQGESTTMKLVLE